MPWIQQEASNRPLSFIDVLTQTFDADGATKIYREFGAEHGRVPLVALTHLDANLDSWNPKPVVPLTQHRRVALLGYQGVKASTRTVRNQFKDMTTDTILARHPDADV